MPSAHDAVRRTGLNVAISIIRPIRQTPSGWVLLTAVYQTQQGVRFFVDGEPLGPEAKADFADPRFTIGAAQIGNWSKEVRTFDGSIDELGILGRTMSDSEVWRLYEAGKP